MKHKIVLLFLVLIIGLGSFGIYFYFTNRNEQPTRGTFIKIDMPIQNTNGNCGDEIELYDLYKSTQKSRFI